MISLLLIVSLLLLTASLVLGLYTLGYSVREVIEAGWRRLGQIYQDWRRK